MIFSGEQNDWVGSWLELYYPHYKVQKASHPRL